MNTVTKFAIAAAIIGAFPCSSVVLMVLEGVLVYRLSVEHNRPFSIAEMGAIWAILLTLCGFLQFAVGMAFDTFGPIGWFAKAGIAFGFVMVFGTLLDSHFAKPKEGP